MKARPTAPASYQKSPRRDQRGQTPEKMLKNQRPPPFPGAHNGLVAGSSPAGPRVSRSYWVLAARSVASAPETAPDASTLVRGWFATHGADQGCSRLGHSDRGGLALIATLVERRDTLDRKARMERNPTPVYGLQKVHHLIASGCQADRRAFRLSTDQMDEPRRRLRNHYRPAASCLAHQRAAAEVWRSTNRHRPESSTPLMKLTASNARKAQASSTTR